MFRTETVLCLRISARQPVSKKKKKKTEDFRFRLFLHLALYFVSLERSFADKRESLEHQAPEMGNLLSNIWCFLTPRACIEKRRSGI